MTTKPSLSKDTSAEIRRCVPMTMSTAPVRSPSNTSRAFLGGVKRLSSSTRMGYSLMRARNVRQC